LIRPKRTSPNREKGKETKRHMSFPTETNSLKKEKEKQRGPTKEYPQ